MSCDLAVLAPFLGRTTETALRRHMRELVPGRTAVLALTAPPGVESDPEWAGGQCLILEEGAKYLIKPPSSASEAARVLDKARRFLAKHKVKAILSEYLDFSTYFIGVAAEMGIPFVAHAHGADASSRLREAEWKRRYAVLEKATAIVTVSHAMKRALEAAGIGVGKIHVIPCGVNIAETPPAPRPHRPFTCLAVGRMTGKKAPIHLLEAFRRALPRMEGARLEFVGDGPLLSAVHEFVKVTSLQDSVRLLGERSNDEVLRLMRDADAFVQHSLVDPLNGDAEGLPASILEAMADGLPVVSTLHAGIPEAVEDGVTGFLVPEGDIQGMADRFVDLAHDPDLRRTMGQSGWSRVRRMFSWELEKEKLLDVLGLRQAAPELPAVLTRT